MAASSSEKTSASLAGSPASILSWILPELGWPDSAASLSNEPVEMRRRPISSASRRQCVLRPLPGPPTTQTILYGQRGVDGASSGDGAGTIRPSHFVGGGRVGSVLDVLYDAAPDLMRLVTRHAWERSAGGEDVFSVAKKEDEVEEEGDEEKDEAGEDGDISLLRRME